MSMSEFIGGPEGPAGQYGSVTSYVFHRKSAAWNQHLELRLKGGVLDASTGVHDNNDAPYTKLRLEV